MKKHTYIIGIGLSCIFFLTNCAKINSVEDIDTEEIGIGLTVNVSGIMDEFELTAFNQKSVFSAKENESNISELITFGDFDAITSVGDLKPSPLSKVLKKDKDKVSLSSPISQGVKFYLVLFEDNNGSRGAFRSADLLTAGEKKTIPVAVGKKYHWVAYSYNSKTDDLPQASASQLSISMGKNRDFLYAKGVTSVISATEPSFLSIIFNHMLTRVGIEINTRGMFADIKSAEVELGNTTLKVADFNLINENITASSTDYGAGVKIDQFEYVPNDIRNDVKVGFLYIPPTTTNLNNFQVQLNKLEIELDNEAKALNNPTRLFNYPSATSAPKFTTNLTNLGKGKSKIFKIDLVESPLTVSTTGYHYLLVLPVGYFTHEVKWARSNLYYKPEDDSYRFQHINTPSNNRNSYFSWGSAKPMEYGKNSDPCALVYPQGVWKRPSAADFYATIGGTVTDVNLLNLLKVNLNLIGINLAGLYFPTPASRNKGSNYIEYTPNSGNSSFYNSSLGPDINNKIRFNFNGMYANVGLVENLIELSLGDFGNIARIWTGTANVGLLGLTGVGAVGYTGLKNPVLGSDEYMDASVLNLLNIDALGINVAKTDLYNIRCVRAQ